MAQQAGRTTNAWVVWDRFMREGRIEAGTLGPDLEASWRRCKAAGVDPMAGRSTMVLGSAPFAALVERKQDLIRVAKPFMESLYSLVAGSSFVVLLFDEQGYLLEAVGDQDRILSTQDLNLNKGALWAEGEVGTNGAGTALVLGRPFQVSGAEHYCQKHHRWTCSGAPIVDPQGKVVGLLDMSGPVDGTHIHTLGLVMAAVQAIQHELSLLQKNQELTLLNNRLSSILLTVTDGVMVLDVDGTLRQINPVAERLLGVSNHQMSGKRIADLIPDMGWIRNLLEWGHEFLDKELEVKSGRGLIQCMASGKPILGENASLKGAVLFVNPINKIKKLINRFSGAQATFRFEDILGQGETLRRAVHLGQLASANESNVLLTGESGTGKEMFAHAIHNQSERGNGPFVAVNCGAIPRELIASELFGYQDGAFTGAARGGRPGKFELASGGTLFLDEIGDMPLEQQIALLRVLQDRTITRLGGDRSLLVDVRIICATHKDLTEEIRKGTFRQDLYYRLNVTAIKLPPLRDHPEDIPVLMDAFLRKFGSRNGVSPIHVAPAIFSALQAYAWPGNIREFQNVVERMVHSVQGAELALGDIPEEILQNRGLRPSEPMSVPGDQPKVLNAGNLRSQLWEEERDRIQASLRKWNGNISKAAHELGMSRNTLYRKLRSFLS